MKTLTAVRKRFGAGDRAAIPASDASRDAALPTDGSIAACPVAAGALRWSLTLQALCGGVVMLALVAVAVGTLLYVLGLVGEVAWTEGPQWLALRLAMMVTAVIGIGWILRWLWAPLPAPEGIYLEQTEAPELHALLDGFRSRFAIAQPLQVCITGEMNASIAPRPRALTLQIGLPLLLGVTPQQCVAILSHEFGHLVLQRIGPGAWAGHLRAWWYRVLDRIDGDGSIPGRTMARVLRAADRRYLADGLRLSRAEEFEADTLAAGAVGAGTLAEALCAVALKEHFLAQDFLPKVRAQVYHRQRPSMLPYRHMASAFMVGYDPQQALAAFGDADDEDALTHPSIRARLARLTEGPWPLPGDTASAAEAYLGSAVPGLAASLDQAWWNNHGHDWQRHHREVQWARRRVASLAERGENLRPASRLELARLVEEYCPEWHPLEFYLGLLAEEDGRAQAMLAVGRLLTGQGSVEGTGYLLAVLDQESEIGQAAAGLLLAFAERTGRADLARRAAARVASLAAMAQAIEAEIEGDPQGEGWDSHGLDAITRRKLAKSLAAHDPVRRAYLVRRISALAPHWQTYLLVIRTDDTAATRLAQIGEQARALLHDRGLVVVLPVPADSAWEKAAAAIRRARLNLRRKALPVQGQAGKPQAMTSGIGYGP
jgi:hypothetical protein